MAKSLRAAMYLRVSTSKQETENQRRELEKAAADRGWEVVQVYSDNGVSGSKARDKRPGLDSMLKDAVRRKFDVCMAWSVDRLGRSLADLVGSMQELRGAKVDLFLLRNGLDTTTPSGRAMFGMLGVFAEFEREMIVSRINAGISRIKAGAPTKSGKPIGRQRTAPEIETQIRDQLAAGASVRAVMKATGVGAGTVQRIAVAMKEAAATRD